MAAVPSAGRAPLAGGVARAPQAAATEGLYARHAAKIFSYCLHQLGSREEAEDAVQTTFMNAFRALGRGVVPEAESAWLFKIAENVCLSRRRSSWRRGRVESPSDFGVIEEVVPGPNRHRDELIGIEDALASMPEQQRRAILLREWQGLSYREIGEELEVSQPAVETLIFRARRSLAQGLEQPDLAKKPRRKGLRRALHVIDLGTIAAAVKTVLAGSAAVKATAAAVAVTAAATAASVSPKLEGHSPALAPADVPAERRDAAPATAAAAVPVVFSFVERDEARPPAPAIPPAAPQRQPVAIQEGTARPVVAAAPAAAAPPPVAAVPEPAAPAPAESAAPPVAAGPPAAGEPVHVPAPAPAEPPKHEEPKPVEVVKSHSQPPAPVAAPPTIVPVPVAPVIEVEPHPVAVTTGVQPVVAVSAVSLEPVAAVVPTIESLAGGFWHDHGGGLQPGS